jgi:hypothetical protein
MATENGSQTVNEAVAEAAKTREYVVLTATAGESDTGAEVTSGLNWTVVGRPTAGTDAEARKIVGQQLPEDERDNPLVAVPARYWKPKARKVKTTTTETWD